MDQPVDLQDNLSEPDASASASGGDEPRVIVIGRINDVLLYRELTRRGVSDYLIAPVGTIDIVRAVCDAAATGRPRS